MQILATPINKNKYKKWATGIVASGLLSTGATSVIAVPVNNLPFKVRGVVLYGALNTVNSQPVENATNFSKVANSILLRQSDGAVLQGTVGQIGDGMGQVGSISIDNIVYGANSFNIRMTTNSGATVVYIFTKWVAFGE